MSLIMDATKAAQREKERRESGANAGKVPLLVPLKTKGRSDFSWRRMILLAGGGGAVVAASWIMLKKAQDSTPRALGPTLSSLVTPPPTGAPEAAVARDTTPAKELSRVAKIDSANAKAPAPRARQPVRQPARVATRPRAVSPRSSTGNSGAGSSAAGELRVAVENTRAIDAARLFAIGVAAHRAGDVSGARLAYEQVLAIAPNDVDVLNNFGVLLTATRDYERAENMLRRAVRLAPSNAGAWSNLGTLLRDRGRVPDAIAAFQHALAIDPRHPGARVSLAQQYFVIGSLAQAQQLLVSVLADHPASPEASYALGQVLEKAGDKPGAVAAYTTFIRVAPAAYAPYVEGVRRRVDALTARSP
jgi:Tfp pilus assembly protein PilF